MAKLPITIRNVEESDKQYLTDLAYTMNMPMAEAFAYIISKAKAEKSPEETQKIADLQAEIENLKITISENAIVCKDLQAENEVLKNKAPETIEKEVEKIVNVPIQLTGSQFICEFTEETANAARKLRKFMREDKHVSPDGDYPNELANVAVKQFIKRNYSDLVNL